MTKQEILDFEENQTNLITLVKEGMFWRAYEQSAYLFTRHFWPELKVNGGYVKSAGKEVYYVGFPEVSLQKIIDKIPEVGDSFLMEQGQNRVTIANVPPVDGFEEWKQGLVLLRDQTNQQMQPYYGKLPLYKAVYDFYFMVVNLTRHFPKDVQYSVGDQLIGYGLELNTQLYRLLKLERNEEQLVKDTLLRCLHDMIRQIDENIETVRFLLRISFDMKLYNVERYADISSSIESIRKQLHGWKKKHELR